MLKFMNNRAGTFQKEYLGLLGYSQGLEEQIKYSYLAQKNNSAYILGLQHKTVITLGKRGDVLTDLYQSREELATQCIEVFHTDRGGQATLHSPGQLVIYPIVPIEAWGISVKDFVCVLQKTTVKTLKDLGVDAFLGQGEPGVYTREGKIAFCGIRVEQGVTRHGISINIENDLSLFNKIRSCGVDSQPLVSLKMLMAKQTSSFLPLVFEKWVENFSLEIKSSIKSPEPL